MEAAHLVFRSQASDAPAVYQSAELTVRLLQPLYSSINTINNTDEAGLNSRAHSE